jgi:hypothetical protein
MKQNTLYSAVVNFINGYKLGETYTSEDFKDALEEETYGNRWAYNGQWYRVRTYQTYLKSAGFITNVKRGVWRINYHVPSWMSLYALETLRGYKDGYWNGREYVKRPDTFLNELTARLKAYKQRIDKDGVESDTVAESQDTKLYAMCTMNNPGYYIKGKEYEVLSVDKNGNVEKIVNEEGNPWYIASFINSFKGGAYRGKTVDRTVPIDWKVGDRFYVGVLHSGHHYIITEIASNVEVTIVTSNDRKRWMIRTIDEVNALFKKGTWNHLQQEEKEQRRTVTCINKGSYDRLTNGKEYKIIEEEDEYYKIINDNGDEASMFKWRFTQTKTPQQDTKKTWKVGDTLPEDLLNNHYHNFHGFGRGMDENWEISNISFFIGDRKIEKIDMVDGRLAALISGTLNIWIEVVTIDGMDNDPIDKVPQGRLSEFLTELEELIAKYK